MKIQGSRWAKSVALLVLAGTLASCGLPRTGPTKREIFAGSVQRQGDAFVVAVNDRVTRMTAVAPALGFSDAFIRMWEFYLCYCEAAFLERAIGDVQMLIMRPEARRDSIRY